ncbi:MAG TPA: hypothetical protein VK184_08340 [Nostocaceae cyanobacterium]|nr:hypothetical protein [Nostocaceae cyanobacterium]
MFCTVKPSKLIFVSNTNYKLIENENTAINLVKAVSSTVSACKLVKQSGLKSSQNEQVPNPEWDSTNTTRANQERVLVLARISGTVAYNY